MRLVSRYNPATNLKVKVAADSFEALNWPTRKPTTKARAKLNRRLEAALVGAGATVVKRALPGVAAAARSITLPQATLLAAAGIASYYATTWLMDQISSGVTDPKYLGAMLFRKAHTELAHRLGRPITVQESKALQHEVVSVMAKKLVVRALPFGLGEIISAITGGRI